MVGSSNGGAPVGSLRGVLDQLGALVLDHDADEGQLAVPITGVVIDDVAFGTPFSPGCAALGVGSSGPAVADLVARAAAAGAAAVFVKRPVGTGAPRGPKGAAPVVEVAPDVGWEQLHGFIRTALLQVTDGGPAGGQTLFDVANAIAVLVDGAVVIEDEHLRVLAYSSLDHPVDDARRATIIGRQIPEEYVVQIREAGITAHLASSAEPVRFDIDAPDMLPRLVIALRSGDRTVGLLWAITDDQREAAARRVLADSAADVTHELLRHLTADASLATDKRAAAQHLLEGRPVPGLPALLGADPSGGFVVLALRPAASAAGEPDPLGRVAQFATVYLDAYRLPAVVAPPGTQQVELVVGLGDLTPLVRARALLDELCERTRATFGIELLGAMGAPVPDVRGVPGSRRDAVAVLDVLAPDAGDAAGGTRTASYEEAQSRVALRELSRLVEGAEHLGRGPVPRLLASPARADAGLVVTARAYLDAGGDVARAAAALDVHRNTVRYRLARFEAVTGLDLTDPADRLVAQIQLGLGSAKVAGG